MHHMGERTGVEYERAGTYGFHELSWKAIIAGTVAMMGLEAFLLLLGSAIGLSALNFYELPADGPYKVPIATIIFLTITILGSSFFGAWIAGHWSNVDSSEDAVMHGALTWAMGALLAGVGIFSFVNAQAPMMAQPAPMASVHGNDTKAATGAGALTFSSLDDPAFANFLANRAETWGEETKQIPVSVDRKGNRVEAARDTGDKEKNQVKPEDVEKNNEFQSFVMAQTGMSEDQAKEFLRENKTVIAKVQTDTQARWEQAHAKELVQAERARKSASALAWTMTILGLLALGASVGGSYLGWSQRNHLIVTDEDREAERSGFGGTTPPPI